MDDLSTRLDAVKNNGVETLRHCYAINSDGSRSNFNVLADAIALMSIADANRSLTGIGLQLNPITYEWTIGKDSVLLID